MMSEAQGFIANLKPDSVDDNALTLKGFPVDAFERTSAETDPPILTLKDSWNLTVAADLSVGGIVAVTGATTLSTLSTTGTATIGGNFQVSGATKEAGHFYTGTDNPSSTTRQNYDGNFHATNITAVTRMTSTENYNAAGEQRLNWYKVAAPATGNKASKTSGWTLDRFTAVSGGLEVDFSADVTPGTKAVLCVTQIASAPSNVCTRPAGDNTYASNTPDANSEDYTLFGYFQNEKCQTVIMLNDSYKAEFAMITSTSGDLYIKYPIMELR